MSLISSCFLLILHHLLHLLHFLIPPLLLLLQVSSNNSLELQEDPYEKVIAEITNKLGLMRIGWIFTDLVADDLEKGTGKNPLRDLASQV